MRSAPFCAAERKKNSAAELSPMTSTFSRAVMNGTPRVRLRLRIEWRTRIATLVPVIAHVISKPCMIGRERATPSM